MKKKTENKAVKLIMEISKLRNIKKIILFSLIISNQILISQSGHGQILDNKNFIRISPNDSRTYMFTNSIGLFYYGESNQPNSSVYQGLNFLTHKFLEDYAIEVNGTSLDRSQAEVHLFSNRLTRYYDTQKIEETVTISDSLPMLKLKIKSQQKVLFSLTPIISGSNQSQDFVLNWSARDKILFIAQKNHLVQNSVDNVPVWIGISTFPIGDFSEIGTEPLAKLYNVPQQKLFIPGKISMFLENTMYVFFIIGESKKDILNYRNQAFRNLKINIQKQNVQIEGIRKT